MKRMPKTSSSIAIRQQCQYNDVLTQKGKCYWLKVYEIPEGTKNSKECAIQNLLNIDSDDA